MEHSENELIEAARRVRENAYAPFPEFKVGPALETDVIAGTANCH